MTRLSYSEQRLRNEQWKQGQLWCNECKRFRPVKDFWRWQGKDRGGRTNYGYRYYCKHCEGTRKRDKKRASDYYRERNRKLKQEFVELSGGECQRCGYNESSSALDFHHVYPAEKEYNPASVVYNGDKEKAWQELDKCCLLCANCHATYEAGEWRVEFVKRDGLGWTVGGELPLNDRRYEAEPEVYEQATLPDAYRPETHQQLRLLDETKFYFA